MEFNDRPDGYKAVQKAYNLNLDNIRTMEPKLRYQAINKGNINLIDAYSTDAELKQYDMVVLKMISTYFHHIKEHHYLKKAF